MNEYESDYLLPTVEGAHFILVEIDPNRPEAGGMIALDTTSCVLNAFGEIEPDACMEEPLRSQEMRLTLKRSEGSRHLYSIEARTPGEPSFRGTPFSLVIDKTDAMRPWLRLLVRRSDAAPIERIIDLFGGP